MYNLKQDCMKEYAWTKEYTDVAVTEYRRFINIKKNTKDWDALKVSPSYIVDKVWHMHILDTIDYMLTCGDKFIHHKPSGAYMNNEFFRAERYSKAYDMLELDSNPINNEIWPKPIKYIRLQNSSTDLINLNMHKVTMKWIREFIKKKYDVEFNESDITFDNDIAPFATIRWSIKCVTSLKRRRTRSECETKQIFIKGLDGKTYTLEVPLKNSNVYDIMLMLQDKTTINPSHQRLILSGQQLDPNLNTCSIQKESTLHLMLRLGGC